MLKDSCQSKADRLTWRRCAHGRTGECQLKLQRAGFSHAEIPGESRVDAMQYGLLVVLGAVGVLGVAFVVGWLVGWFSAVVSAIYIGTDFLMTSVSVGPPNLAVALMDN
jgi:Flp pilus assembly pilin Flp